MATAAAPVAPSERSQPHVATLAVLSLAGIAAASLAAVHVGDAPLHAPDFRSSVQALAIGLFVSVGTYTSWRRPRARFGVYLIGIAFLYAVSMLAVSPHELAHSVGRVTFAATTVCLAYVYLVFPHDHLTTRLEQRVIAALALSTAAVWIVVLPLVAELPAAGPLTDCSPDCPHNAFQVVDVPHGVSSTLAITANVVTGAGLIAVAGLLFAGMRSPLLLRHRLTAPLLVCACVQGLNYVAYSTLRQVGVDQLGVFKAIGVATVLAIPIAMLVGQIRGRVFAATSFGQQVVRLGGQPVTPERVEGMLSQALGDQTLRLALWDSGTNRYVDVNGNPAELPADSDTVTVTFVARDGRNAAALVHDASLDEGSGIVEGLAATSLLLLENTALVDELRASRRRIVASAHRERLRLERNLHDGAQQRLFAIQIKLGAARELTDDEQLGSELDEISADAAAAVQELRELAQGLYPTVLRERGLADALRSLEHRAAIAVDVVARGLDRCSDTVEEALYFCVLEAIQNVTKHAGSGARVTVRLERSADDLEATIADDGSGFDLAEHANGIGLVSMRDRIGAVGGTMEIAAAPGAGTTIRLHVPRCWPIDGP